MLDLSKPKQCENVEFNSCDIQYQLLFIPVRNEYIKNENLLWFEVNHKHKQRLPCNFLSMCIPIRIRTYVKHKYY